MAYTRPGNASLVSASINRQMVIKTRGQRPSSIETQYRILTLNSELYDLFCHKGPPLSQEQMPPTGVQYFKMGFVGKKRKSYPRKEARIFGRHLHVLLGPTAEVGKIESGICTCKGSRIPPKNIQNQEKTDDF